LSNRLLTISIPTYCRPEYLVECLDALLISSRSLSKSDLAQIEVCVFDNSEDDDRSRLVCESNRYTPLNLLYKKNMDNIGSDKNILQSLLAPKSRYVAIMSDDDFVETKYFSHILRTINDFDPDIIFLKAYGLTGKNDLIRPLNFSKNKIFTSPIPLLFDRLIQVGFVSTAVYRRDKIDDSVVQDSVGTNLVQVGACFSVMANMSSAIYSGENMVKVTRNNSGGYSPILVFYTKFFQIMQKFNYYGMSERQFFRFKNKMLLVFYSRNFAQHFRAAGKGLFGDEKEILDDAFLGNNSYRFLIRKLFIMNNTFSYMMLSLIFVLANVVYYPGRFFDFLNHIVNYSIKKISNLLIKSKK